jgi:hypothetical protein
MSRVSSKAMERSVDDSIVRSPMENTKKNGEVDLNLKKPRERG